MLCVTVLGMSLVGPTRYGRVVSVDRGPDSLVLFFEMARTAMISSNHVSWQDAFILTVDQGDQLPDMLTVQSFTQ